MPRCASSARCTAHEVGDRERAGSAGRTAGRWPGRSTPARSCPGSRPAGWRRRRRSGRCRRGLPGPIRVSHQPGRPGRRDGPRRARRRSARGRRRPRCARVGVERRRTSRRRPRPAPASRRSRARSGSSSVKRTTRSGLDQPERAGPDGGRRQRRRLGAAPAARAFASAWSRSGDQVVDVLDADRQAHGVLRDAGRLELVGVELRVRRRGGWIASDFASPMFARWMNSRRLSMNVLARLAAALDAERDERRRSRR